MTATERWDRAGRWFVHTPLRIVIILAVAVVVTWVARRIIRRTFAGVARVNLHERAMLRTNTLSTVIRSAVVGVIWTIAVITIIGELKINLGAFVATAAVAGGAIGFGAQQVVRDFLAGMFVLAEDQYGVGDLIDVGYVEGQVERVSLRSVLLRDAEGRLWHVPHGNVQRVANLSQGWTQAVLDVAVPRTANAEAAIAELRSIVESFAAEWGLSGYEVRGVEEILDDRIIVRLALRTTPMQQAEVIRALRLKVLSLFNPTE